MFAGINNVNFFTTFVSSFLERKTIILLFSINRIKNLLFSENNKTNQIALKTKKLLPFFLVKIINYNYLLSQYINFYYNNRMNKKKN